MNSRVPSGKSESVGFKSFKPFLTFITCSLSFVLQVSLSSEHFRWGGSMIPVSPQKMSAPICCKSLHTVFSRTLCKIQLDMPVISTLSLREYSAFVQHWPLREATCFTRASFTFLQAWRSDSSLLKLAFKFLISPVNLHIVLLLCSWILRSKSIIWLLVKELKVWCANTKHNFSQQ